MKKIIILLCVLLFMGCDLSDDLSVSDIDFDGNELHISAEKISNSNIQSFKVVPSWMPLSGWIDSDENLRTSKSKARLFSNSFKIKSSKIIVTPKSGYEWKYWYADYDKKNGVFVNAKHGKAYSAESNYGIVIDPNKYYIFGVRIEKNSKIEINDLEYNYLTIKSELDVFTPWNKLVGSIDSYGILRRKTSTKLERLCTDLYRLNCEVIDVKVEDGYEWKYWYADYDKESGLYINAKHGKYYSTEEMQISIDPKKYYMFGVRAAENSNKSLNDLNYKYLTIEKDQWKTDVRLRSKQMAMMRFETVDDMPVCGTTNVDKNYGALKKSVQYTGAPYSSVAWMNNYIGTDISFKTFFTSLKNPNSKINSLDLRNGNNRGGFYGTVCSAFACYALGLDRYMTTRQMYSSSIFEPDDIDYNKVAVGNILIRKGHVEVITGINYSGNKIDTIEITESTKPHVRVNKDYVKLSIFKKHLEDKG
ncbi:MAG TPA: hypothetical protein P5509_00825, partial [Bacteroidales bacterium]|nr:hypothetical protein [Bacteroidales bacterium]